MQQPMPFLRRHLATILLGSIIIVYLFNGIYYLQQQSITSDEGSFMHYAIRYLKGQPDRVAPVTDNSKMPVSVLNLFPRIANDLIGEKKEMTDGGIHDTMRGRYITLIVSVLTILLVYKWSKELYGTAAGLFSAFLMSVCPNNLASAGLVTTDSYSVLMLLGCMYCLWRFCRVPSVRNLVLVSLLVALAQLVKQSLFHLYVLVPLVMLIYFIFFKRKIKLIKIVLGLFLFALINFFLLNGGYYFHGSFLQIGDYNFKSQLFQNASRLWPETFPVPLPRAFIEGLDMAKYYDQVGGGIDGVSSFGKPTILGEARTGGSFWYYYLVSLFYKTPISYILLFAWALWLSVRRWNGSSFFQKELFLFIPVIYFILVMSFFYKTQCGLRHLIFIYPFIFIFCGSLLPAAISMIKKITLITLSLWLLISVGWYWGNYFPYTNEFVIDKKNAWSKVGAANLEFHQGYYFAEDYLNKHPDVKWAPSEPAPGKFIINTEDYEDVWNRHKFDWIRNYPPTGHVAYNFLLIEVPGKINSAE
jgi:hypothetical protein